MMFEITFTTSGSIDFELTANSFTPLASSPVDSLLRKAQSAITCSISDRYRIIPGKMGMEYLKDIAGDFSEKNESV